MAKAKAKLTKVKITLVRSIIGTIPAHRRTLKALGLSRISQSVEKEVTPQIAGMIKAVTHLVKVEEIA